MELNYIRCGDYYIPELKLSEEKRPIGKWGRMHRDYLKEHYPVQFNLLDLSGNGQGIHVHPAGYSAGVDCLHLSE